MRYLQSLRRTSRLSRQTKRLETALKRQFGTKLIDSFFDELNCPTQRVDFSDAPNRILFLLFNSRSGSSYAGRILSNAPQFGPVDESLNVGQLEAIRLHHHLANDAEALRWMVNNRGTSEAFGVKGGPAALATAIRLGFLAQLIDRTRFAMIERRDKIAQAVSKYKMELTGVAQSTNEGPGKPVSTQDYSRADIDRQLISIDNGNRRLRAFLSEIGVEGPTFFYEDICESPLDFVNGVFAHIGFEKLKALDTQTDIQKIGDAINAEWIERYNAGR